MSSSRASTVATLLLAFAMTSCVDPGQSFSDYDNRVIDASPTVVVGNCNGGEIPDVNGEFFLGLAPIIGPEAVLRFIMTTEIDRSATPATMNMVLQPLCVQAANCELGTPVGDPVTLPQIEVGDDCTFSAIIADAQIDGNANALSGNPILANLEMLGSLRSSDLYCGIVNGTAEVGGTVIPIDGSTFGAVRVPDGTRGADLPEPTVLCPEDPEDDPDAGVSDAGVADADTPDADTPDAG